MTTSETASTLDGFIFNGAQNNSVIGENEEDEMLDILESLPPVEGIRLSFFKKVAIGSGHFLNDLCASLWFSYLLLYLQFVVGFNDKSSFGSDDSKYAGALMLIGQVVDGISTPIIGYEVDHSTISPKSYGRCKSWHLLGSILVILSFPFIFSPCIGCSENSSGWVKLIYYAPFIAVFQIGWASVQVSHLALIPKMHPDDLVRTELFSIRYAFTVIANVTIFLMTWFLLTSTGNSSSTDCKIDQDDSRNFMLISLAAMGIGLVSTIFFHLVIREESDDVVKEKVLAITTRKNLIRQMSHMSNNESDGFSHPGPSSLASRSRTGSIKSFLNEADCESSRALLDEHSVEERSNRLRKALKNIEKETEENKPLATHCLSLGKEKMTVADWFKLPQTYIIAFIYMSSRLSINLGQVYIPLYIQESLHLSCSNVATLPLAMYVSGFSASLGLKLLNKWLGRQFAYSLGAILSICGSILILLLDWDGPNRHLLTTYVIYIIAFLLGAGASTILVTSLSITGDLIGSNVESGAFVYGIMSFCDKLSCGLTILLINDLDPLPGPPRVLFYRNVLGYSVGGTALLGIFGVILITIRIHYQKKIVRTNLNISDVDI